MLDSDYFSDSQQPDEQAKENILQPLLNIFLFTLHCLAVLIHSDVLLPESKGP